MTWTMNDLEPGLQGTLYNGAVPVTGLDGATAVIIHIRRPDATLLSRAVTLADQLATPGVWSIVWATNDLNVAGSYNVEIEVEWTPGRKQTFGGATFSVSAEIA